MIFRLARGFTAALLLASVTTAQQVDRPRTEALAQRAADRLRSLHEEADRLATEERTLLNDLQRLEFARRIRTEELEQADGAAADSAATLAALDARISRLDEEDLAARPGLAASVVQLYKLGRAGYLRLWLATSDLHHLGQASRMVAALAARDQNRLANHQRLLTELTTSRATQVERQQQLAALRLEANRARDEADRAVSARNRMIRTIDQQRDLNAQLAGELQAAQQKLQGLLAGLPPGAAADPGVLPLGPFRGALEWPVNGVVRRVFGSPSPTTSSPTQGIDIAAAERAPVQAVHDGIVAFADTFVGLGRLVIIDHGSQGFTLYGNLGELSIARGVRVEHGQTVGTVGVAPNGSAGLYFELRVDGRPVDPLQWLRKR